MRGCVDVAPTSQSAQKGSNPAIRADLEVGATISNSRGQFPKKVIIVGAIAIGAWIKRMVGGRKQA